MIYYEKGGSDLRLSEQDLKEGLYAAMDKLGRRKKVLAVPPDITRYYSRAGILTRYALDYYGERLTDVLPALGTHAAMTLSLIHI